ncbi:MAG TPA: prenyltransferase/squalene oxidase repeat-containing protein [Tepidisphaeraceae bacterium]|nr:prenyltransferase/squalene oxidase repeat-containing protein [Tepidisphaeraceae bacterium]
MLLIAYSTALGADELPPTLDAAASHGLDFLISRQNPDGSFGPTQKTAVTGLALMSFLSCGHTPNAGKFEPNVGKYGSNVRAAIDYLLSQAQPDGSFSRQAKPMYGQGIATLALAEAYGVEENEGQRKRIAAALANSVKLIIAAQDVKKQETFAGGWRYEVNSADSDLSLTGWNALALRACQNVGINVPRQVVMKAVKFTLKCYSPQSRGFSYQPGSPATASMTAVGLVCLHLLDGTSRPEIEAATASLAAKPLDDSVQYPYYDMYYATQAAYQSGGAAWTAISKEVLDKLVKSQQSDGGWPDAPAESSGAGATYTTSMALMALSIPYRLLPVYQR